MDSGPPGSDRSRRTVLKTIGSSPLAKIVGGTAAGAGMLGSATQPVAAGGRECPDWLPWSSYSEDVYYNGDAELRDSFIVEAAEIGRSNKVDNATEFLITVGSSTASLWDGEPSDQIELSTLEVEWDDEDGFWVDPEPPELDDEGTATYEDKDLDNEPDDDDTQFATRALKTAATAAAFAGSTYLGWTLVGANLISNLISGLYTSAEESDTYTKIYYDWEGQVGTVSQAHYLHYIVATVKDDTVGWVRLANRTNEDWSSTGPYQDITLSIKGASNADNRNVRLSQSRAGPDNARKAYPPRYPCDYWLPEAYDSLCSVPEMSDRYVSEMGTYSKNVHLQQQDLYYLGVGDDDLQWFGGLIGLSNVTYDCDYYLQENYIKNMTYKINWWSDADSADWKVDWEPHWIDMNNLPVSWKVTDDDTTDSGAQISEMMDTSTSLEQWLKPDITWLLSGSDISANTVDVDHKGWGSGGQAGYDLDDTNDYTRYTDFAALQGAEVPQAHSVHPFKVGLAPGTSLKMLIETHTEVGKAENCLWTSQRFRVDSDCNPFYDFLDTDEDDDYNYGDC